MGIKTLDCLHLVPVLSNVVVVHTSCEVTRGMHLSVWCLVYFVWQPKRSVSTGQEGS